MTTAWQPVEVRGIFEIPGLTGVRVEALPVFNDPRGSLHELYRSDEIPTEFKPVMACCSWSTPGVTRGPHQHVVQDDYFTFAGPSDFCVYLWDDRPGAAGAARGWSDRKSTRLNSSHRCISYAVFCLKKTEDHRV